MSTYPLRLTSAQYTDIAEHYADNWPADDDPLDDLCATGEPCDGHCGDAGCPVYEQFMRRVAVESVELGDDDRDAIPF